MSGKLGKQFVSLAAAKQNQSVSRAIRKVQVCYRTPSRKPGGRLRAQRAAPLVFEMGSSVASKGGPYRLVSLAMSLRYVAK